MGATIDPLQIVSEWMPGGTLPEYIKNNLDADRLGLVGISLDVSFLYSPVTSYPMSLMASATSTLTM